MPLRRILIVGSGRLAHSLLEVLNQLTNTKVLLTSRNRKTGISLAKTQHIEFCDARDIPLVDHAFLCVTDSSIAEVAVQLKSHCASLIHLSGGTPLDVLPEDVQSAVFYPFQTFSERRSVSWKGLPVFIQSNHEQLRSELYHIAAEIGANPQQLDDDKRRVLHLAGVLANNFTTLLIGQSKELLKSQGIDQYTLQPILEETISKALDLPIQKSLTGPAIRGDQEVIDRHLEYLYERNDLKELYLALTKFITTQKK